MSKYNILLVEDDDIDVMAVKRALEKSNFLNPLFVANNGIEALELLRNSEVKRPLLILLDLNMPKMNGLEFLDEIKKDEQLKDIPVVVLTSSKSD